MTCRRSVKIIKNHSQVMVNTGSVREYFLCKFLKRTGTHIYVATPVSYESQHFMYLAMLPNHLDVYFIYNFQFSILLAEAEIIFC